MNQPVIREISISEFDICADITRRSFSTVAAEFGLTEENCPTNGAFIKSARLVSDKDHGVLMYLLCANDKPIGFFALKKLDGDTFELEKLSVLPEHRHFGYGKAMVEAAKEISRKLGGKKIKIGIIEENVALKNWYAKLGFLHTGTKVFPHLPFTVGFMEMSLDP